MKNFHCTSCEQTIIFENTLCGNCGHKLGFLPDIRDMTAVEPEGNRWIALAAKDWRYRFCKNWELQGCNWLTAPGEDFCLACRHNRTIPDLSDSRRQLMWQKTEQAKRRLFYSLIRLGMPLEISGRTAHLRFRGSFSRHAEARHGPQRRGYHHNGRGER